MKIPIPYKLASRTAKFFWKKNIITTLCATVAVGTIIGTVILNDSIGRSMQAQTDARLGRIVSCLATPNDFRAELATDIAVGQMKVDKSKPIKKRNIFQSLWKEEQVSIDTPRPIVVATLRRNMALQSIIDGKDKFTQKQLPELRSATLWGIGDDFAQLDTRSEKNTTTPQSSITTPQSLNSPFHLKPGEATINVSTANQWNVKQGDIITITIDTPGDIPHDSPFSKKSDVILSLSVSITHIVPDDSLASVTLNASQKPAQNVFVNLEWLQEKLNVVGRANTLFADCDIIYNYHPVLDDYGFQLRLTDMGFWTVSSRKMVFSEQERSALLSRIDSVYGKNSVEVYSSIIAMINEVSVERISTNTKGRDTVSYAFVAATDDKKVPFIQPGQTAVTQWLADQMKLKVGDTLYFQYFATDATTGKLSLHKREWQVSAILKEDSLYIDTSWIPNIPGVSNKNSMDSWDAAFVSQAFPILPADEDHWSMYGAIPKMYINLDEARALFSSRHGTVTSVRVWSKTMPKSSDLSPLPQEVGWTFIPIRQRQMQSSVGAYDFLTFFLLVNLAPIVFAITMMILFMRLNLAYRCKTIGLLQALGWNTSAIRKTFVYENAIISTVGSILGIVLGIVLAFVGLIALNVFGRDIIGVPFLHFHASIIGIILSAIVGWLITFIASIFCIRSIDTIRSIQRLHGYFYPRRFYDPKMSSNLKSSVTQTLFWLLLAALAGVAPLLSLAGAQTMRIWTPTVLFSISVLALMVGILTYRFRITGVLASGLNYDFHGEVRHPKRSVIIMSVATMMTFAIPALSVFLLNITNSESQAIRDNGGYRMVLKTAIPIYEDINTPSGRDKLGFSFLEQEALKHVNIDYGLIRDGDDASLENLYYPHSPRIIGLSSRMLNNPIFAWRSALIPSLPWEALSKKEYATPLAQMLEVDQELQTEDPDVIAIKKKQAMLTHVLTFIADNNTLKNRYHLNGLDSRLVLDDRPGREVQGRVVAVLDNDMFHGSLVTSEENLRQFFPEVNGYRIFFVDCSADNAQQVQKALLEGLSLYGPEIETSYDSHVQQAKVHNGWIRLTQVWLLFGFALCSCGFYPILKRNILVRKSELATLFAIGMTISQTRKIVSMELLRCYSNGIKTGSLIALCSIVATVLTCHNLDIMQLLWTCSLWLACALCAMFISSIACHLATKELTEDALVDTIKQREC